MAAGFENFRISWRGDVYSGARQASSAAMLGTLGIDFAATKPFAAADPGRSAATAAATGVSP